MFGAGLDVHQLAALIERDLHLHVAFPCFPLESTLGHTACCVVQKSWLDQLHKGTATGLYNSVAPTRDSAGAGSCTSITGVIGSSNTTESGISGGEVNVFINVISKTKPLQQDNWTRARAFAQVGTKPLSATSNLPTQKSFTTFPSVPSNDEWNLTVEAYVRELMDLDQDNLLKTEKKSSMDRQPCRKVFQSLLESDDMGADEEGDSTRQGHEEKERSCSWERNEKLIEHVLDIIYPNTLRYRLVYPSNENRGEKDHGDHQGNGNDSSGVNDNASSNDSSNANDNAGDSGVDSDSVERNDKSRINDNSHGHNHGDSNTSMIPRLVPVDRTAKAKTNSAPSNIAAATVIIESDDAHYCLSPHRSGGAAGLTTLQDLLRFNPGNLDTSLKKGFLVYQLLKAVEGLHQHGLVHGSIKPSNIYIDENLWITLTGIKCSVPYHDDIQATNQQQTTLTIGAGQGLPKEIQDESTVMKWVKGEISNFTYLMILNHAAGRRYGDPNVHPIFPWVTDFTGAKVQQGWRDFTKTKFRLNKGDEQLDVTYDGPIPHHITDILSDITYYVYMARRIPIPVLCQFVRSKYEANEYPSSIRRLYEWTPDECIPEFYTDPNIFRSIHADMPDMALPAWASTPEDFIRVHREALESDHVSRHLHKWIDLTFGYKLSGPGAVEAKNVALSLFPGQSEFMKHGIIQLFTDPHPQRLSNWSLSKEDFLKSQTEKQTDLEKASKTIKRRSAYLPQSERPQFVDKVSDLLFRPTGPTRSKSIRHPPGSRPISIVANPNIFEREPTGPSLYVGSPPSNGILMPKNAISQDTSLALASSTRPEALIQFIQSETIEFSKDLKGATFTEELEHFEATYRFGSKYHFMNSSAARARILADTPDLTSDGSTTRKEDSFEYMQSWDVYCLGEVFKQIYLAQEVPNNSIDMALKPETTLTDLTKSQHIPVTVSGTIIAMLNKDWNSRPLMDDILQKSVPALSLQSPTISMFVPTLMAEIYEFLAMFYVCPESTQMELANKWIDRICAFEDETFDIALPVLVQPFTNEETRLSALSLFPKLGQRLGTQRTKTCLLKPIIALFEATKPILPAELLATSAFTEFLRRFGSGTFLQQLFPYYLESLTADYGLGEIISDDNSSSSSLRMSEGTPLSPTASTVADDDSAKKSVQETIPSLGKAASEAFVGICRSIGPILTSKHVMRPFSRLAYKDPISLPLLKETLGGIAQEFGSTFALVQFSHIIHLIESSAKTFNTRTSNTMRNLLGMLGSLVPHMYDTQLVTELKNGGSDLIYRLIEPSPRKPTNRQDSQANPRLAVSRHAMDFILQLSSSLTRTDWEKHIAPILQKYFSGFGPETDETSTKTTTTMDIKRNEQMMYAYGQLCSCVGQEAMQSMIPASEAIERLIAARLASKEFGNSPLRSLGSITAQGKFVLSTSASSTFWQQQKNQQARDAANAKKAAFSTKDLWSATSASMSKALSLFDSTKSRSMSVPAGGQWNGNGPPPSASSALASISASTSTSTLAASLNITSSSGLTVIRDLSPNERGSEPNSGGPERSKSPEFFPAGSLSPVLGAAPAKKHRQSFGSQTKAKTAARLEQLSNWNRFLSTNQEEMAKSMQFAFNDWKLQGFEGHTSSIRVIGANEYQRILATGSKDRMVKLWSLDIHRSIENPDYGDTGSGCLMTYNGHRRGPVYDLHFATGGGSFGTGDIVASCDGQIHLWEPETGKSVHQFNTGKAPVVSMAPIHRSRYIVAGLLDSTLSFLDSHTHTNLHNWRTTNFQGIIVKTVTVSPSETLIATGFSNGSVSLLESRTGTLVGSWRASDNEITQMKFYTNDVLITSAAADHMLCLWDVHTLSLIKSIRGTSEIISLEIFKDEIITMHYSNSISFTPINDDSLAYTSKFKSSAIRSSISCISILPMNQLLVLGCMEGDLYLYS